ncbi:MAG: glycosyl transferase family protein [Bryobacteraceae bacterium]
MNTLDAWVAAWLVPLAAFTVLSGFDDLLLDAVFACRWLRFRVFGRPSFRWPSQAEVDGAPRRRIAIFVPLWREDRVIGEMLERNVPATVFHSAEFFVGVYPNDQETLARVREACRKFPRVHLAVCPHDGPTSKADCLNWIYQNMLTYEEQHGDRFDCVVTHDAEDVIHPESLRWINYFAGTYDMVQIPVLPLPMGLRHWVHGLYCDEFAEFQTKDIPVRQIWGIFLPGNGVGTGFSRAALEQLAETYSNRVFDPECLTEDYENGWRIHALGRPQIFVPLRREADGLMATREYFPQTFRRAVRQRARWVIGIALQSWERRGWQISGWHWYWLWRDRKGLVANLAAPLLNLIFLYGAARWLACHASGQAWLYGVNQRAAAWLFPLSLALSGFQMAVRGLCSRRIYGWRFAIFVPVRMLLGNVLNCAATIRALYLYGRARVRGEPLVWVKTEHAYPSPVALSGRKRSLGEILVGSQYVTAAELEDALASKRPGERLGEYFVRMGMLSEQELYEALSLQQNLPFVGPGSAQISAEALRTVPGDVSRRWRVLPFEIAAGELLVAGPELPCAAMTEELAHFSRMEVRFHLMTPTEFDELAAKYLGAGRGQAEFAQTPERAPNCAR